MNQDAEGDEVPPDRAILGEPFRLSGVFGQGAP